jgi:hypothetical protein
MGAGIYVHSDEIWLFVGHQLTILHLGVIDVLYNDNDIDQPIELVKNIKKRKFKKPIKQKEQKKNTVVSTGFVAEILENKYHIMENFINLQMKDFTQELENALVGSFETMVRTGIAAEEPFQTACSKLEHSFKLFLSLKKLDALGIDGVPTKAAKDGISKRFKKGQGPKNRPSFIDTGLYEASFKAWID